MRLVNLPVFKQLDEIVLAADWNLTLVNCASYHVQAMCTENGILAEEPNEKMQNGAHHRLAPLSLMNRRRAGAGGCSPQFAGRSGKAHSPSAGRRQDCVTDSLSKL
jgi:hypothetical protein